MSAEHLGHEVSPTTCQVPEMLRDQSCNETQILGILAEQNEEIVQYRRSDTCGSLEDLHCISMIPLLDFCSYVFLPFTYSRHQQQKNAQLQYSQSRSYMQTMVGKDFLKSTTRLMSLPILIGWASTIYPFSILNRKTSTSSLTPFSSDMFLYSGCKMAWWKALKNVELHTEIFKQMEREWNENKRTKMESQTLVQSL